MKNEGDKIDDVFKQKLEGYQVKPSVRVWKNIVNQYIHPRPGPFHLLNLQNIIGALILVGTGITTYLIWPSSNGNEVPVGSNMTVHLADQLQSGNDPISQDTYPFSIPSEENSVAHTENPMINNHTDQQDILDNTDQQDIPVNEYENTAQKLSEQINSRGKTESTPVETKIAEFQASETLSEYRILESINRMPLIYSSLEIITFKMGLHSIAMHYRNQLQQESVRLKDDYRAPARFSAGIHFLPEWTNYRNQPGTLQSSYTQEIMACFEIGNLIIRPGIGLNRSQDDGNYMINYSKYEMTGYYLGITPIWIDPINDTLSYVLDEHGIYDTVYHNDMYRTDNAYTYLEILLQIGFRFLNYRRFSMVAIGGPSFSYLLNEKKSDLNVNDLAAENMTIEDQTPARRVSNWQFLVGLNSQYLMTNKISVTLEPTYRQYFKPVYNGYDSGWPPYSFGIRVGINYHF